MKRALAVSSLLAVASGVAVAQQPAVPARPKLVVLCVVDQLAAWVFEQGRPFLANDGGFARLLRDGAQFTSCAYEHACTETAPGHATIGTGVAARVHGIVRNRWYRPDRRKAVPAIEEEVAALPDQFEGKDRGASALLVPTFASALKAHIAGSLAGSVSWKDRSAILMAGRDADVVVWCEVSTGCFVTNTAWCDAVPPWLEQFNAARPLDGFFGWQWTRSGPDDAYAGLVDDRPYENPWVKGKERTLPQTLTGGLEQPGKAFYERAYVSPVGNTAVRLAAEAMVRGMGLGADAVADLLCVSFSSTDTIGHNYGPDSYEARDALLRLDRDLAQLFRLFDEVAGKDQWALFLTADHGVQPTPEWAQQHGVRALRIPTLGRMVESAAKAALAERFGPPAEGKPWLLHVGEYACELDNDALAAAGGADAPLAGARAVAAKLRRVRGVCAAFAVADLRTNLYPDALQRSWLAALHPERAGDVVYVLEPYWQDSPTPASHGTPHPYDREVVGFAIGPGVPAGARIGQPITPGFGVVLFARMLGIPVPNDAPDALPPGFLGTR